MAAPGAQAGRSGESPARGKTADGHAPPPYEQARDELTELVRRLEAGGLTLEESLRLWERGEQLAAICEDWLEGARARLAEALAGTDKPSSDKRGTGNNDQTPGAPF